MAMHERSPSIDGAGPPLAPGAEAEMRPGSYHYADITAAEAYAVNQHINIVAYAGVHSGGNADYYRDLPELDIEYDAAKSVVDSLDPSRGDALFVESFGHSYPQQSNTWLDVDPSMTPADMRDMTEYMRRRRSINVFDYAAELALLRGIPVIHADMHTDTELAFNQVVREEAAQGRPLEEGSQPYKAVRDSLREEQGANVVKDYALVRLAELPAPPAADRKPTYALLFGAAHYKESEGRIIGRVLPSAGVTEAFNRMGLAVQVRHLPNALRERRLYSAA
jgi:hypothetical protein